MTYQIEISCSLGFIRDIWGSTGTLMSMFTQKVIMSEDWYDKLIWLGMIFSWSKKSFSKQTALNDILCSLKDDMFDDVRLNEKGFSQKALQKQNLNNWKITKKVLRYRSQTYRWKASPRDHFFHPNASTYNMWHRCIKLILHVI